MKKGVALSKLLFVLVMVLLCSCSTTRYYIVRHAEKLNNTDDPPLNDAGFARAKTLADTLRNKSINMVYTSDKQRTAQTAEPTASLFSLTPIVVPANETNNLISQLRGVKNRNVLVVRHSNELDLIVNGLSPHEQTHPIANEYYLLFLVTRREFLWQKKYSLQRLSYGAR